MARGFIRKPSFNKVVGAYRSQWKRFWLRLFTFGIYGSKGIGWLKDPKKAWYNFWYNRTSVSVYDLLGVRPSRLACFFAVIVAIVATPVDAISAGAEAHKIRKERKKRDVEDRSEEVAPSSHSVASATDDRSAVRNTVTAEIGRRGGGTNATTETAVVSDSSHAAKKKAVSDHSFTLIYEPTEPKAVPKPSERETPEAPDENVPKSKPKHEKDQYIRKRIIIDGCSAETLSRIGIGAYLDVVAGGGTTTDKDAVMLTLDGEKIGYIAKTDRAAYVTCLKLKRRIYGVITDVLTDGDRVKYELETWFDSEG